MKKWSEAQDVHVQTEPLVLYTTTYTRFTNSVTLLTINFIASNHLQMILII